jgi:tRNA G46 methylase TrmB
LFFSIQHHNTARYLFITLAFAGLLSTGWFGIPLLPKYFLGSTTDIVAGLFTLFSALGTIWGVMAYREFTRSVEIVIEARLAARRLDPAVGEYEYRSYDPTTRKYEAGFVPSGPIDFWDRETQVPDWMDKGKYWHVLRSLRGGDRDIRLMVVKDKDLPFEAGPRVVAVTRREKVVEEKKTQRYRYVVRIPQWLVLNTERKRYAGNSDIAATELSALISDLNKKIVDASSEVAEWEGQRIRYPWKIMTLGNYLNKSLPITIVYHQVIRNFPGAKKRVVDETNSGLASINDDDLVLSLLQLASKKDIPRERMEMIQILIRFLKNAYARQGLGEGASEYHSFHHSLEVSYMALHMLPRELEQFTFGPKDYELMLVASLLHDYDPSQATTATKSATPKGPSVVRTIEEMQRSKIIDAYYSMSAGEFENYFRESKSGLAPPVDYATTHPEYVKSEWSSVEATTVEALIWRTDFPFKKQKLAQEMFARLLMQLTSRGQDGGRVEILGEVLWLADLAVTYMGSDPVRAWDRVTNLYDELNLPRLEAVPRTDAFFEDFAGDEHFNEIINMKYFPDIFRQRWKQIYDFFHEGNPSTPLIRTIEGARKMYSRINLEIGMRKGELLHSMAANIWSEYFIGIGKDQNEVFKAKSRFGELDPQNASAFWGDSEKLVPSIANRSIDNFFLVLPEHSAPFATPEGRTQFRSMLSGLTKKLTSDGALRVLTDVEKDTPAFRELLDVAGEAGFQLSDSDDKTYFPKNWRDPEFKGGNKSQILVFVFRQ